jgi:D-lactate dehydrogenase
MKVVIFEAAEWERDGCLRLEPAHQVRCTPQRLTVALASEYADAEVVTIFIESDLSEPVLAALPNLKLIATRSTGYDHIDLEACRQRGVAVCNVPAYGDPTVAEHAFALLLAVTRRIVEAADRSRAGDCRPNDRRRRRGPHRTARDPDCAWFRDDGCRSRCDA